MGVPGEYADRSTAVAPDGTYAAFFMLLESPLARFFSERFSELGNCHEEVVRNATTTHHRAGGDVGGACG